MDSSMNCSTSQHMLLHRAIANINTSPNDSLTQPSSSSTLPTPPSSSSSTLPTPPSSCPSPSRLDLSEPETLFLDQHPFSITASPPLPLLPNSKTGSHDLRACGILSTATHVLSVEAAALSSLKILYATDALCRANLVHAVEAIVESQKNRGKTVITGMGKSGKIGKKLEATMHSLGIRSQFLNPANALHGDLGIVNENDVLLMITFSGKTKELLELTPHLPVNLPLVVLTSHASHHTLPLVRDRQNAILLPTPIPEPEVVSFGLAAPTTSTTVAMALCDALVLSVSNRLHDQEGLGSREVFMRNHPGGAIGMAEKAAREKIGGGGRIRELAVHWTDISTAEVSAEISLPSPASSETCSESGIDISEWNLCATLGANGNNIDTKNGDGVKGNCSTSLRVLDCLRLAVQSPKGWMRTPDGSGIIPPKKLSRCQSLTAEICAPHLDLVVDIDRLIKVPADAEINDVAKMLDSRRSRGEVSDEDVVAIIDNGKLYGVFEVGDVFGR